MPSTDINGQPIVIFSKDKAEQIYQILKFDCVDIQLPVIDEDEVCKIVHENRRKIAIEIMHKIERDLKL